VWDAAAGENEDGEWLPLPEVSTVSPLRFPMMSAMPGRFSGQCLRASAARQGTSGHLHADWMQATAAPEKPHSKSSQQRISGKFSLQPRLALREAKKQRAKGQLDKAVDTLESSLSVEPHNAHLLTFLAKVEKTRDSESERPWQLLHRAAELHPTNPVVLQAAGVECARKSMVASAREYFRSALDAQPGDGPTLQAWARLELAVGSDEQHAEELLRSAGWEANCLHQLAVRREKEGSVKLAAKLFVSAAKADTNDHVPLQSWAELEMRRGRHRLAKRLLSKALDRAQSQGDDKGCSCAYCSCGTLERLEGKLERARSMLQLSLKHDNCNVHACSSLAAVEIDCNKPARAARLMRRAIKLNGEHVQLLQVLGNAQRSLGELEKAQSSLRKALSIDSANTATLHVLGLVLLQRGDVFESRSMLQRGAFHHHKGCMIELAQLESNVQPAVAYKLFERANELYPSSASVLRPWALHERKHGNVENARSLFREASTCANVSEETFLQWGFFEKRMNRISAARSIFKDGLTRFPRSAPLWYAAAMLESQHGAGLAQPINLLQQALDMCPNDPSLRMELALALWHEGNISRARKQFDCGLKIRPIHVPLVQAWADFEQHCGELQRATRLHQAAQALEKQQMHERQHSRSSSKYDGT
jgi:tetratricopeptide (TPR) repeat protein